MTNVKKLFDKVTKDVTTDERKKGTHTARKDSMIDPYGLQPTPGDLYKSPFIIKIVLDENGNEIKKELIE